MRLSGKVALITGGSSGIGRAAALKLAAEGTKVVVGYGSNAEAATKVVEDIRAANGTAEAIECSLSDISALPNIVDCAQRIFGRIDILVNAAGVAIMGPFASINESKYDRMFAITKGTFFLLQAISEKLEDNGRIINFSTGLTRNWALNAAAYAGSKAAIEQFTRSISRELGPRNITANVILPGVTNTDMTADFPPAVKAHALSQTSLGRLGEAEDIADVVALLASDEAGWITGQLIVANGGSTP